VADGEPGKVKMAGEHELGAALGRYEIDNRRRRRIAFVAIPVGGVVACVGVLMLLLAEASDSYTAGAGAFPSIVSGIGFGSFLVGLYLARLSATRTDEAFTLHEHGFVHSYSGKTWAISWAEIADVKKNGRDNALNRALGGDVQYNVKLRSPVGGRKSVTITGLTDDAARLGETVRQAALHGIHPERDPAGPQERT
jgi:hypothetical protein